jgi:hypothetical protein
MGELLGTMFTITTYGCWLRGDERGWVDHGKLMPARPPLEAADRNRMKHPEYEFADDRRLDVGTWLGEQLIGKHGQTIWALAVRSWHVHFIVAPSRVPVAEIAKSAKEGVRYGLKAGRPIWCDGYDKRYCFDERSLEHRIRYVERHNEEDGLPSRPWSFIKRPEF